MRNLRLYIARADWAGESGLPMVNVEGLNASRTWMSRASREGIKDDGDEWGERMEDEGCIIVVAAERIIGRSDSDSDGPRHKSQVSTDPSSRSPLLATSLPDYLFLFPRRDHYFYHSLYSIRFNSCSRKKEQDGAPTRAVDCGTRHALGRLLRDRRCILFRVRRHGHGPLQDAQHTSLRRSSPDIKHIPHPQLPPRSSTSHS